jgi:type I restriction enzyme S subunit
VSFPRYPKYKATGVEWFAEVPEHWEVQRLAHIGPVLKGSGGSKEDIVEEGVPCVRYGDLYTTHSFTIRQSRTRIAPDVAAGYTRIHYGDVLFAGSGETFDEIGKSAVNLMAGEAFCGGDLAILRPSGPVDPPFLGFATDSLTSTQQKASMGRGTTVKHIYPGELKRLVIAMPPVGEQALIAEFLERETAKIDALVTEQRRLIELLKEKRQGVISQAVTKGLNPDAPMKPSGFDWIGDIPEHWTLPPLHLRYDQVLGKMLDQSKSTGEHPTPYLRNADVRWDYFNIEDLPIMDIKPDEKERFTVRRGDLLTVEGRELGRAAIWDGDDGVVAFQKALHRLRPLNKSEHTRYFYYTLAFANSTDRISAMWSASYHVTEETSRFILSTG